MSTITETPLSVELREVESQPYLGKSFRVPLATVGQAVQEGFAALYAELEAIGAHPAGPPFLVAGFPRGGYLEFQLGAPCDTTPAAREGFEPGLLPAGRVAVTVHRGPYDSLGSVYERFASWIQEQHLQMTGLPREVYLTPPGVAPVTEVVWPVGD